MGRARRWGALQRNKGWGVMALDIASVAAPAVAGAAAPMLQVNRCLTRAMVEAVLQHTAQPLPGE